MTLRTTSHGTIARRAHRINVLSGLPPFTLTRANQAASIAAAKPRVKVILGNARLSTCQRKKLSKLYFIGQFVMAAIALIGGGYVINAGSDLQQAKIFRLQLSIQDIAPDKFSDFKRTVLRPEVRRICMTQVADSFAGKAKPASFAGDFCDCYVQHVTDAVTKDDMVYLEQFKEPSSDMENRMQDVRQSARQQCHS